MSESLEGTKLGAYRIEKLLGEGAMGEVYHALHEALGRQVAIKKLKPHVAADRAMTERFFAEARAVNIIRHENIVECTDLVNDGGASYIVMELLEGRTLSAAIRQARQMPPVRAVKIAAQIADALAAAHGKGIVHRDLKPDNVFLIKRAGSSDYVKVLDFGMARLRPELGGVGATQSGALIGTPAYMSPEQARGEKVGPAADIYALGVVLFHMLSGQLPFAAESLTMMLIQIVQETPPRLDTLAKDVPVPLVDLVGRCLEKSQDKRPPDMATLRRELHESVGLPVETAQSIAAAQSPLAPGASSSVALGATLESGPHPRVTASALAETSAPGLGATTAPAWSSQSSVSAATGEVSRTRTARKRWPMIAAGVGALAIAAVIGIKVTGSSTDNAPSSPSTPAAAPAPASASSPAAPASASSPASAPASAASASAPASASASSPASASGTQTPPSPPAASGTPATAGSATGSAAAAPTVAATPATPASPTRARATTSSKTSAKQTTAKQTTAKAGAGSAAPQAEPTKVDPKPVDDDKVDRTKTLVGPKPPAL